MKEQHQSTEGIELKGDAVWQQLEQLAEGAEELAHEQLKAVDRIAERNQWKVIQAFQRHKVSDFHFTGSTGYGYNDRGREVLDLVYADVFGAEAALVRPHFVSGTHTIGVALFGLLRPGDELLYITGSPYDTLHKVIGKPGDGTGSLQDWGIGYNEVPLLEGGALDWERIEKAINGNTKVIGIQRSRGYSWRSSFTVAEIGEMVRRVKKIKSDVLVFVDNCYGEFTELTEPTQVGVDLMAGSLIKNPGRRLGSHRGLYYRDSCRCRGCFVPFNRSWHWRGSRRDAGYAARHLSRAVPCAASRRTSCERKRICRGLVRAAWF